MFESTFPIGQTSESSNPSFSFANNEGSHSQNMKNNQPDRPDLMTYLEKDFISASQEENTIYKTEILKNEIKHLQTILPAFGFVACGNLLSTNFVDVESTVKW